MIPRLVRTSSILPRSCTFHRSTYRATILHKQTTFARTSNNNYQRFQLFCSAATNTATSPTPNETKKNEKTYSFEELLELADKKNDSHIQSAVGTAYFNGTDEAEKNITKALQYWNKAAEQGNAEAIHNIGMCYLNGEGVAVDVQKGLELLHKSADQNITASQSILGVSYFYGEIVEQDIAKALPYLHSAAANGCAESQVILANAYNLGYGVEKDPARAFEYARASAEQNNERALFLLGTFYFYGIGVTKDQKKGFQYVSVAAEKGNAQALATLGRLYLGGDCIVADYNKAYSNLKAAVEIDSSDAGALIALAECYVHGYGVEKNLSNAVKYWKLAADQGHTGALTRAADCLFSGENGVQQDKALAKKYYLLSAQQGNHESAMKLRHLKF